jgi:threonine aldolase
LKPFFHSIDSSLVAVDMLIPLFCLKGTMGNLICVLTHCQGRGEEFIVGDQAHIYLSEQGSFSFSLFSLPLSRILNRILISEMNSDLI